MIALNWGCTAAVWSDPPGKFSMNWTCLPPVICELPPMGTLGHRDFPWERTDKVKELRSALL